MHILRNPEKLNPCVLVLGMFDGVHRGHQALLMRGDELAQSMVYPLAVCSFEPHPLRVLRPEQAPKLLTTLSEKARLMQSFGVDGLCVTTFDQARANQSAEEFMDEMVHIYAPVVVVCGYNFTFGRDGAGNGATLREYGKQHGFRTVVVRQVMVDGQAVSSTRIRGELEKGDIHQVNHLLGHAYTLSGRVGEGKKLGRELGFPTANLMAPAGKALPAFGVYACWLEDSSQIRPAVVNVGRHPTLPEGPLTVEAHILGAEEPVDLYGRNVRLSFLHRLREERRFDTVEELQGQIAQDVQDCQSYFDGLK